MKPFLPIPITIGKIKRLFRIQRGRGKNKRTRRRNCLITRKSLPPTRSCVCVCVVSLVVFGIIRRQHSSIAQMQEKKKSSTTTGRHLVAVQAALFLSFFLFFRFDNHFFFGCCLLLFIFLRNILSKKFVASHRSVCQPVWQPARTRPFTSSGMRTRVESFFTIETIKTTWQSLNGQPKTVVLDINTTSFNHSEIRKSRLLTSSSSPLTGKENDKKKKTKKIKRVSEPTMMIVVVVVDFILFFVVHQFEASKENDRRREK